QRRVDQGLDRGTFPHIHLLGHRLAGQPRAGRHGCLGRVRALVVAGHDPRPSLGQHPHDRPPNPARAAGDDCDLIGEVHSWLSFFRCPLSMVNKGQWTRDNYPRNARRSAILPIFTSRAPGAIRLIRLVSTAPGPTSTKVSTLSAAIRCTEPIQRTGAVTCATSSRRIASASRSGSAVTFEIT